VDTRKNNMKSISKNLAAILTMAALTNVRTRIEAPTVAKSIDNVLRAKGLKLFNIDGVEVWALNEKNARRKAKKQIS
jgi:hypothetical protein